MKMKIFLPVSIAIFLNTSILTGCWNYREVEKMTIAAGMAVDKGKNSKYQITTEIVDIGGGKEVKPISRQIIMEGNTIFDAVRNEISLSGKKLYWGHATVVILSKDLAREGIVEVLDWINRDSETRANVLLFISKEKKAADIFKGKALTNPIMSYELADMAQNERNLSKAPNIELWDFVNKVEARGVVATVPIIQLNKNRNMRSPQIMGTAIFKKDKLIGFLSGKETKYFLFVRNDIKGGLLITNENSGQYQTPVALEIFKSKTKTTAFMKNNRLGFNVQIFTTVGLDEIGGPINILDEKSVKRLERQAERNLKTRVENCIKHVQAEYGVDIFGFGEKLREDEPKIWKRVEKDWEKGKFQQLAINVQTKVHIKGSGMLSKTIEKGE